MRYYEYILQKGREMNDEVRPKIGSEWVARFDYPNGPITRAGDTVVVTALFSRGPIQYKNLRACSVHIWDRGARDWHDSFVPEAEDKEAQTNNVDKPSHYNNSNIEAIEYIKDSLGLEGFSYHCEGTAKKYLHRFRYKGKPVEDLKKARQYLDWLIETEQEKDNA